MEISSLKIIVSLLMLSCLREKKY